MGITGLVFGCLAVTFCWIAFVGPVLGVVGIILSAIAIKKNSYKGCAIGGLVTSIVGTLVGLLLLMVCLTPKVNQWVEESRNAIDANNYDSIVEACNTALADAETLKESNDGMVLTGTTSGWNISGDCPNFKDQMNQILGYGWQENMKIKASNGLKPIITVLSGHVYRTLDTEGVGVGPIE